MVARILGGVVCLQLAVAPLAAQTGEQLEQDPDEAASRVATRGANFLELGVGARAMALGGAYTALAEGVSAMYWNSAGLARTVGFSVGYSYSPLFPEVGMDLHFIGLALPLFGGVVGASANLFTSGEIERTTLAHPDGGDPLFGSTFEWTGQSFALHYALNLTDRLQVGFAGRVVSEGIPDAKATYYGVDVGTQFRTGLLGTVIGASINNLGSEARITGRATEVRVAEDIPGGERLTDSNVLSDKLLLPTVIRFSVMWDVAGQPESLLPSASQHHIVVLTEIADAIDTSAQSLVGIEYTYNDIFFARGGKKWMNETERAPWDFADGLSGGIGIRVPVLDQTISFDYAYVSMGDLDNLQVFTFQYGF